MRFVSVVLPCIVALFGIASALPSVQASQRIDCEGQLETVFFRVKQKYGNFTQPTPGENLEQRVLFNEFFNLMNQTVLARETERIGRAMAGEAAAMDAALARIKQQQDEFTEFQNLLPASARGTNALPPPPCPCATEYSKSLKTYVEVVSKVTLNLEKAAKEKLYQACAAQDVGDETITAGQAADGVVTLVSVEKAKDGDGWTISDGRIELKRPGYGGVWQWAALPQQIPAKGFARTLIVRATAEKWSSITTAIEYSTDLWNVSPPPKAYITAKGGSETQSVVMNIGPGENLRKGDKFHITIGAAWGPTVTYRYVVK